ncbi:MAG: hypothetical protein AB1608_01580 [Thermoproteota archaeon]
MRLIDVIDALMDTYNSIDVRTFVFFQDNVWKNIFTIIRLRKESVEELKKQHEQLIAKCGGLIQTSGYRVDLFQFPIEKWQKITENLSNQFLCLTDSFAVNYFNNIHFNHSVTEPYLDLNRDHVYKTWNVFTGYNEIGNISKPNYIDKLFDEALTKRFSHFHDYLSAILEFDQYDFQHIPWIRIYVPVYFKVDGVQFNHDKVNVKFTTFPRENLELTFNFFSIRNYKSEFIDKKTKSLELDGENALFQREATIELGSRPSGNEFELLVTKNGNILIEKFKDKIGNHWKESSEFSDPFRSVFNKYVDFESLEKMLMECESIDYKDPAKVFERGVSWVLSLLGIQNMVLGGFEKINGNSVSTDILGNLDTNSLLLVNVTAGFPKEGDFDKESEYRKNLLKMLSNKDIEIKSVYFTPKEPTEFESAAKTNQVLLIGRSKIKVMLDHLKKGELEEARKVLNPSNFDSGVL